MGLDTVELVMQMEETFGIVVDDLDAERIGTVGQAYRYILRKLELRQSHPCPSAALFYRLRRALMESSGADRKSISPSALMATFLPETGFRAAWIGLGDELGVRLPGPVLSAWQSRLAIGFGLTTGAIVLAAGSILDGGITLDNLAPALGVTTLSAILGWASAYQVVAPFASTIPPGCETIRGTVQATLSRHFRPPGGASKAWHPNEVWAVLRDLISEQVGVPRDEITEEKHFVHDFGMD
jgi:acyl carrier protein